MMKLYIECGPLGVVLLVIHMQYICTRMRVTWYIYEYEQQSTNAPQSRNLGVIKKKTNFQHANQHNFVRFGSKTLHRWN